MTTSRSSVLALVLAVATLAQGIGLVLLGRLEWRLALEVMAVTAAIAGLVHQAWVHRLRLNHRIDMFLVMGVFGGLGMLAGWWVDLGFSAPPRNADFHAAMGHGCGTHGAADTGGTVASNGIDGDPSEAEPGQPSCCPDNGVETNASAGGPSTVNEAAHGDHGSGGGTFWPMVFSWMTGLMLLGAIPTGLAFTRCAELARTGRRRWISTHLVGNAVMIAGMVWLGHWLGPILANWIGSAVVGGHVGMLAGMLIGMEAGMFAGEALLGLTPWREFTWTGSAGVGSRLPQERPGSRY